MTEREKKYRERATWLILKDLDCTIDYQGSFDKDEVIENMMKYCGFLMQGQNHSKETPGTILDNDEYVGRNCLTYMTKVKAMTVRCKLYNKMVQSLETRAVRSVIGQHWKDWIEQEGSCLAENRDQAQERGLTRIEVTFYCRYNKENPSIPSDHLIALTLGSIKSNVPNHLVYSTPYRDTMLAYYESMVHTLIVVERMKEEKSLQ